MNEQDKPFEPMTCPEAWLMEQLAELQVEFANANIKRLNMEAQLLDWTRRSESCESRLGQLEANERLIELEAQLTTKDSEIEYYKYQSDEAGLMRVRYGDQIAAKDAVIERQRKAMTTAVEMIETEAHERRHVRWELKDALAIPNDDSALQEVIKQAKKDALLGAADWCDRQAKSDWYGKIAGDMIRHMVGDSN